MLGGQAPRIAPAQSASFLRDRRRPLSRPLSCMFRLSLRASPFIGLRRAMEMFLRPELSGTVCPALHINILHTILSQSSSHLCFVSSPRPRNRGVFQGFNKHYDHSTRSTESIHRAGTYHCSSDPCLSRYRSFHAVLRSSRQSASKEMQFPG